MKIEDKVTDSPQLERTSAAGKRPWVIHPFLAGVYPVVALFAFNLGKISPEKISRSFAIAMSMVILLFLISCLVVRDSKRAGLLVSIFIVFFYSYGHVYRWSLEVMPTWFTGRQNLLIPALWLLLLAMASGFVWFRLRRVSEATNLLNTVVAAALLLPTLSIGSYFFQGKYANPAVIESQSRENSIKLEPTIDALPDIYYIVLDAYGREDVLRDYFGFDNSVFLSALRDKGFYVSDQSHSNYVRTLLSLSASMNITYLDALAQEVGADSHNLIPLQHMTKENDAAAALREIGYEIISISTGYEETSLTNANRYLRYDRSWPNSFEFLILSNTPLGALLNREFSSVSEYEMRRNRLVYAIDELGAMADNLGPKFVFAHILSPHPPYVFGANGEEINLEYDPLLHDEIDVEEQIGLYRDQLAYTNTLIGKAVGQILDNSATPPIIVIHGDHGPWLWFHERGVGENCLKERFGIFNAYYLPDGRSQGLYDSISPVNSFRLIFDTYFGTELGLLEDRSFYSAWPRLYDFTDVTAQADSCSLLETP